MGMDSGASAGTMGNIGSGLQIAGVIGQTLGAYKKSSGEQNAYEFQSKVAKKNAAIAEVQAKDAMLRGENAEQVTRTKTANLKGTQRASLAARGIDLGEGSALNILTDTDFMGERDALLVHDNANKEVWGLRNTAQNYTDNAMLLDWRAQQQSPAGDAFGTLLTGAGRVASSWYALRNRTTGTSSGTAGDGLV